MDIIKFFAIGSVVVSLGMFAIALAAHAIGEYFLPWIHGYCSDDFIDRFRDRAMAEDEAEFEHAWFANHLLMRRSYGPFKSDGGAWEFILLGSDISDREYLEDHGWMVGQRCIFRDSLWPVKLIAGLKA